MLDYVFETSISTYRFRMPRTGSETLRLHSGKCWECINSLGCFRYVQNVLYNQAFCLCHPELRSGLCWIRSCLAFSQQEASTRSVLMLPLVVQSFVMLLEGLQCLRGGWEGVGGRYAALGVVHLTVWSLRQGKSSSCNYRGEIKLWAGLTPFVWCDCCGELSAPKQSQERTSAGASCLLGS